jgi:uncharacterized protein (TIGR02145 family)
MRHIRLLILTLLPAYLACSCSIEKELNRYAQTCEILQPAAHDSFVVGDTILIKSSFSEPEETPFEYKILINDIPVWMTYHYPFDFEWKTHCLQAGSYSIKAIAMDIDSTVAQDAITIVLQNVPGIGSVTDIEGNTYPTMIIGEQCWMAEDLRTTRYPDGSEILQIRDRQQWATQPYNGKSFCYYNFDTIGDPGVYGALYTWSAAVNGSNTGSLDSIPIQGVCPTGWHVPSDLEWQQLEMFLGMPQDQAGLSGWRGTDEGSRLKDLCSGLFGFAYNPGIASGFRALPGSSVYEDGGFTNKNYLSTFWSSTAINCGAWSRKLEKDYTSISRGQGKCRNGFSVRCVKNQY